MDAELSMNIKMYEIGKTAGEPLADNNASLISREALPRALTTLLKTLPKNFNQITGDTFDRDQLRNGLRTLKNFQIKGATHLLKVSLIGKWSGVTAEEIAAVDITDEEVEALIQKDADDHKLFMAGLRVKYTCPDDFHTYAADLALVLAHAASLTGPEFDKYAEDTLAVGAKEMMNSHFLKENFLQQWLSGVPESATDVLAIIKG